MITSFRRQPCLRTQLAFALLVVVTAISKLVLNCMNSHHVTSCNSSPFAMLIPPVTFSFRPMSSHDHSSEAPRFVQILWTTITLSFFVATAYAKNILGKIILLSKRRCLVCENWTWSNGVVVVLKASTSFSLATPDAFDRRRSPFFSCGCYRNSIAFKASCSDWQG